MKRLLLALCLLLATPASAGKAGLDIEHFLPQIDGRGLFSAESADAHDPGQWGVGLFLHYAKDPLVARRSGERFADQVSHRLTANILASVGIARWFELGLAIPVGLVNEHSALLQPSSFSPGLGMLRLLPKFRILREGIAGLGLALGAGLAFPTGDTDAFLGQDGVVFSPVVILEKSVGPVRFLLDLGFNVRSQASYLNVDVSHELFMRLGVGWRLHDLVEVGAELNGSTQLASPFGSTSAGNPLELLVGARILPTERWQIWAGIGPGLSYGYGTPLVRAFAGVAYSPHERDTDGDGVPDRLDQCPKEPGPASNRGCPEKKAEPPKDRDGDGVPDNVDRCPDQPGPKENQGCPWPDRDGDGVLDKDDRCPDQPGPKENQGCPWPDRDGDGVPDKDDDCPDQPGPASNKGCPVKAKVVVTKTEVKILERVNFATGSARITRDSYAILNAVAQVLKEIPALTKLEVQGHTDDTASRRFNLKLSQRRANAVKGFLVKRGIEGNRLVPKGYGPDVPLVKVDKRRMSRKQLREARYQNRRVQFLILERSEER